MSDVEATKIISPLTESNIRLFLDRLYKKLKGPSAKYIGKYRGGRVYAFGDLQVGYVVLVDEDGDIVYFVRHKRVSHNALRLGRQVLLWRHSGSLISYGFAQHIFFDYLLPEYGALISDKEQTRDGKRFWSNAIAHALDLKKKVYFLDRRYNSNTLHPIESSRDVKRYENDIWGTKAQHIYTFAVISNQELTLKGN